MFIKPSSLYLAGSQLGQLRRDRAIVPAGIIATVPAGSPALAPAGSPSASVLSGSPTAAVPAGSPAAAVPAGSLGVPPAPAVAASSVLSDSVASSVLSDSVAEGLNAGQQSVLDCIKAHEGINVPKLSELTNIPSKSIERHVSVLIERGLIEHRGSKKTGGYHAL